MVLPIPNFVHSRFCLFLLTLFYMEHNTLYAYSCYMQSELYPRLIQDVQLVISELGNVTVLWEELWLSTLQDLHTGMIDLA